MNKLVSIIIPTYGGGDKLSRAIDSIINQTYQNIEIIIVDDNIPNSENRIKTEKIMEIYKSNDNVKYIKHNENKNGAAARNTGISHAKGQFITFLDDDDFLLPMRIERSIEHLNKNKEYQAVYCNVVLTNNKKIVGFTKATKPISQKDILLNEMIIGSGSNIFLTKEVLDKVKGFDISFRRHQDLEFMIRVAKFSKILNLNEYLIVKANNITNNVPKYNDFKKIKKNYYEKFNSEIKRLTNEEIKVFKIQHYTGLFYAALESLNKEYINEATKNLKHVRDLKLKEYINLIMAYMKLYNTKFYANLKLITVSINEKNKIKQNKDLSSNDIKYIYYHI